MKGFDLFHQGLHSIWHAKGSVFVDYRMLLSAFKELRELALENLALRQQLEFSRDESKDSGSEKVIDCFGSGCPRFGTNELGRRHARRSKKESMALGPLRASECCG